MALIVTIVWDCLFMCTYVRQIHIKMHGVGFSRSRQLFRSGWKSDAVYYFYRLFFLERERERECTKGKKERKSKLWSRFTVWLLPLVWAVSLHRDKFSWQVKRNEETKTNQLFPHLGLREDDVSGFFFFFFAPFIKLRWHAELVSLLHKKKEKEKNFCLSVNLQ